MDVLSSAPLSKRSVPQNLEAERALLGGLLLDNRKIPEILELIPTQARRSFQSVQPIYNSNRSLEEPLFAYPPNQEIYETIFEIFDRDRAVDLTTLGDELDKSGRFEAVGGAPYLASLEEEIVSTLHLNEYVRIVVEKWRLRTLLRVAESIVEDVRRSDDDPEEIIDRSEGKIFDIAQQAQSKDFVHVGDIAVEVMAEIEQRSKHEASDHAGLSTGFADLDRMTTGLRKSNLIILAARPSVGKSAFAMNIAAHVSVWLGKPVGIFSLEMSSEELNQRLLCTLASVPLHKVRSNKLTRDELDRLHAQTMRLSTAPLYIDDTSALSVLELRARARRLKAKAPDLAMLMVDYLQLMHGPSSRTENRQQEVSAISRSLKSLARDLEIPVIALSQLSRQSEQRAGKSVKDRMPKLSDLRESGAIEQDADLVIFIHREFGKGAAQDQQSKNEPDLATIRIGKQRNGPVGDFNLLFRGELTQFVNVRPDARGPAGRS